MITNRFFSTLFFLSVCGVVWASAQEKTNFRYLPLNLYQKRSNHATTSPTGRLFLHLDKNVYSPEETLWFKAYLLRDTSLRAKVLYVRIIDEEKIVVAEEQFPMYDIRSHGSIQLSKPAKSRPGKGHKALNPSKILLEGRYTLYAYTDQMLALNDTNVYVQHFRISRMEARQLEAEASVQDTSQLKKGGQVRIMIKVSDKGFRIANVKGEFQLLDGGKEIKYGKLQTNSFGEAFINFQYPEKQSNNFLKLKILFIQASDYVELALNLPHSSKLLAEAASAIKFTASEQEQNEKDYSVRIHTIKQNYGNREKITVTLIATNSYEKPVSANLSIAVVQKNRLDSLNRSTILRRWNEVLVYKFDHSHKSLTPSNGVTGRVIPMRYIPGTGDDFEPANWKIRKVELRTLRGIDFKNEEFKRVFEKRVVEVDVKNNTFFLPDSLLHSRKGQEWELQIPSMNNVPHRYQYLVEWLNPDIAFDSLILSGKQLAQGETLSTFSIAKGPFSTGFNFDGTNLLREVVIGIKEKPIKRSLKQTNCERYEAMIYGDNESQSGLAYLQNYLVKGRTRPFAWNEFGEAKSIMYLGCGRYRDINYIRNITLPELFPHKNYETDLYLEKDDRSTLYWEPNLLTDAEGKVSFSFYTSDVEGEFGITAQGLDIQSFLPLVGKGSFKVKE